MISLGIKAIRRHGDDLFIKKVPAQSTEHSAIGVVGTSTVPLHSSELKSRMRGGPDVVAGSSCGRSGSSALRTLLRAHVSGYGG